MRKILFWISIIIIISFSIFIGDILRTAFIKRTPLYGSIILLDNKGGLLTEKGKSGGYMIPYTGSLNTEIINNIIQIEDNRFWSHHGIDLEGKIASLWENIQAGGIVRGGSTITEQYVKNIYYPEQKRTLIQKFREGILALILESSMAKEEILRGYLDNIYFGNNLYGLASIERVSFAGKNPTANDQLDIITRIHSPNVGEENRETVLAYREKIRKKLNIGDNETNLFEKKYVQRVNRYPHVTERIQNAQEEYCSGKKEELLKWTMKIKTDICTSPLTEITLSLDGELMEYARIALSTTLDPLKNKNVTNGAVYIYNPTTKKIITYIANKQSPSEKESAIDMIQERRSVGSILKPFIYLLALRMGYDSNDLILDDTKIYPTGYSNKGFVPVNYVEKSYGPIRMKEALGNSLNSSTVRLSEKIGIGRIYDFFRENGLDLDHDAGYYGYGITLGGVELSLSNIVESYANLIDMTDINLVLLDDILKDPSNRSRTFGISSILNTSLPLPVKTGTSTDFRDNWTLSYSKDAIIGVWVGNSDASPMEDVSGVSGAGPLWHTIAEYMILRGMIERDETPLPSGIHTQEICLDTKCYQKELRLSKKTKSPKSRPINNLYYEGDFITNMTVEEMKKWNILRDELIF